MVHNDGNTSMGGTDEWNQAKLRELSGLQRNLSGKARFAS